MTLIDETIEYDNLGRMKYHPDYHFAHGQRFTEEETAYICRYIDSDEIINLSLAIGKTQMTISDKASRLRRNGKFEMYRKMWENGGRKVVEEVIEQPESARGKLLNVFGVKGADGIEHKAAFVFSKGRKLHDLTKVLEQEEKSKKAKLSMYGQSLFDSCFKNW